MTHLTRLLLVTATLLPLGCSAGNFLTGQADDAATTTAPLTTGCLAGVVVDGVTSARIDVSGADKAPNMFVLYDNQKLPATSTLGAGQAAAQPNLVGEYTLCNVPLEVALPFFVAFPGYQAFQTEVLVAASAASQSKAATADLPTSVPTAPANIEVFQLATAPAGYNVTVAFNGAPLPGALVWLMPTGTHVLEQGIDFLPPDPTGLKSLNATTDANGVAAFNATDLALGGIYDYQVLPADASAQKAAAGTVSIGLITAPGEPYGKHVDLAPVDADLAVVSSSLDNGDYSKDGSVKYYFNRPIELVPGTIDGVTATLDHAVKAVLAKDTPGNNASEQVTATVSGQALTLTPNFTTAPDPTAEPAVGVTYNNVQVRPTSLGKQLHALSLSPRVSFFGGVPPPSVATTVTATGSSQQGSPGRPLSQPIGALVVDQFGTPMAGVQVAFAITAGGGSLTTLQATTNAAGNAQTFWTLGASGVQTVSATAGTAAPATITATFLPVTTITIILTGNNQSALIATTLPQPLTVKVQDINMVLVPGAAVTFAVADQTNGGTLTPTGGAAGKTVTATSDVNGQAAVQWLLGGVAGTYMVNVNAGTAGQVNFSATALAPSSLLAVSGTPQTVAHGNVLAMPIVAEVKDQNMAALPGVTLQFAANTGGMLSIDGGVTFAATVTATSNAQGEVSAIWKVVNAGVGQTTTVTVPSAAGVTAATFTATGT